LKKLGQISQNEQKSVLETLNNLFAE